MIYKRKSFLIQESARIYDKCIPFGLIFFLQKFTIGFSSGSCHCTDDAMTAFKLKLYD